jgi:hypothetical protein
MDRQLNRRLTKCRNRTLKLRRLDNKYDDLDATFGWFFAFTQWPWKRGGSKQRQLPGAANGTRRKDRQVRPANAGLKVS